MFKRLSKSRRHSADEVGCSLPPGPVTLEEPPGLVPRKSLEGQIQALNTALLRVSRNKYARRSCGDAPSLQSLLASVDERSTAIRPRVEADYQTVTAVPAFIVEHEPEKLQPQQQQRGLGVWGRRMSKKIESFRRAGSRESICSPSDRPDHQSSHENNNNCIRNNNNNNNNNDNANNNNNNNERLSSSSSSGNDNGKKNGLKAHDSGVTEKTPEMRKAEAKAERKLSGTSHRSPSPFKSFFIRMGSTGMLNSTRSNRRSQNMENTRIPGTDKDNLFRSCSTSHLNTSPTYVKGDDPSEGIDLQIAHRKDRTLSCDDLAARQTDEDVFDNEDVDDDNDEDDEASLDTSSRASSSSFRPCDFGDSRNEVLRKSSSCDFKETKKCNFPYAFLRSKLSVLPEERHQQQQQQHATSAKDDRLFKATSEEHFPTLKIEESFDGTTTLGRRRTRNPGASYRQENGQRYSRNSYAEYSEGRLVGSLARCEQDRYSLNTGRLERIEDNLQQEDRFYSGGGGYARCGRNATTASAAGSANRLSSDLGQSQETATDFCARLNDRRFSETSSLNVVDLDVVATLRSQRRNSAPSAEQRLSSHYVSSNESGYDSDGPRGESAAASENEAVSLKCINTDSSDTSSVIDSEIEKPMRSSTPSECTERDLLDSFGKGFAAGIKNPGGSGVAAAAANEAGESIDGLRWHQSSSGRILPSIHQGSYAGEDSMANRLAEKTGYTPPPPPPHRARLQQDKTRFLSDIIQQPKQIRRCRIVQLDKRDARESLGIRLAQQQAGELRYIVVQLESGGIAHRDGRLRLGDEIVEVEGKELKTLESLAEVQEFLKSFTGKKVRLTTAYEETLPQVLDGVAAVVTDHVGPYESLENAKNLSSLPPIPSAESSRRPESAMSRPASRCDDVVQLRKRPDNLALNKNRNETVPTVKSLPEGQQYLTKHRAKFQKGYGKPSLGFSVVGGRDSPRGEMGIFVRRVFPGGQADISKALFQGDEILSLNGKVLRGYTHQEVIELFKAVREGPVELELARRHRYPRTPLKSAPY